MHIDTGHLVNTAGLGEAELALLSQQGYVAVPPHLAHAARRKLAGQPEATVNLHSGGKLSRWAAGERRKRRKVRGYKEFCR